MHPADILYVPNDAVKAVALQAMALAVAFVTSVAIYRIGISDIEKEDMSEDSQDHTAGPRHTRELWRAVFSLGESRR